MRKAGITLILAASVTFPVLAGIAALVAYASHESYTMVADLQENALTEAANLTARSAEVSLRAAASVTESLAGQDAVKEAFAGQPGRAQELLRSYASGFKEYFSFFLFDAKGKILAGRNAEGLDLTGGDRADTDYVKAILSGQDLVFSKTAFRATTGDGLIYVVAKAVRGPDGTLLGGVASAPRWDRFTASVIDPVRFGRRGYGFMLDGSGRIIAHATDKALLSQDVSREDFIQKALKTGTGLVLYDWKGEEKAMAVARIPATGWLVCMSSSVDEITAAARSQRLLLIGIGAAVTAALAAIICLVARGIIQRPLLALVTYADKVTSGDFNAVLEGTFRAELGLFADSLRRMVGELKTKLGFSEGVLVGIPTPCGIVGPDSNMFWINGELYDLLGKKGHWESYLGQPAGEFYLNDKGSETLSEKAIRERHAMAGEFDFVTPSGKQKRVSERTTPFYDLDGTLLGAISFWTDLTQIHEQKRRIEEQNDVIARTAAKATAVADRMAAASEELSAQIEQSNRGAQEQNDRVQETATAVEEMNATILEVAKNASSSAQRAAMAADKARLGAGLVSEVEAAVVSVRDEAMMLSENMRGLGEQARGIGTIMDVISDIADQTNLLALNAAIEAARAGDAGRGFAVVADEVRKLAEKTMNATKEVGQAIAGIQQGTAGAVSRVDRAVARVGQATELAERSGLALTEIVTVVEAAGDQVRSIATAAEQQSATSEEINRAVESISAIASETAQGMHQSAEAVSDLAKQAQELNNLIADLHTGSPAQMALEEKNPARPGARRERA